MKNKLFLLSFILLSMTAKSQTYDDSIPPGKTFDKALFRLSLLANEPVHGILVLVPGSNSDGRESVTDPEWMAFAKKHRLAIMGCYFTDTPHENMAIEYYANASQGSGEALLSAISHFADKARHPELINTPLFLWGHSAGGQFNYEFVCWKPERVFAFVVNKGGVYYTQLASPAARAIPGIFFTGGRDLEFRTNVVKGIFTQNRRFDAHWCYAHEPDAGHEVGGTKAKALLFFERCMISTSKEGHFVPRTDTTCWIGDFHKMEILQERDWTKKDYPDSWLPDEVFANAWLQFTKPAP